MSEHGTSFSHLCLRMPAPRNGGPPPQFPRQPAGRWRRPLSGSHDRQPCPLGIHLWAPLGPQGPQSPQNHSEWCARPAAERTSRGLCPSPALASCLPLCRSERTRQPLTVASVLLRDLTAGGARQRHWAGATGVRAQRPGRRGIGCSLAEPPTQNAACH